MVYIEKRKIGNNVYLYLCKKERVNGKVKRTLNLYLGKEENLRERLSAGPGGKMELKNLVSYEFGYIAALWKIAKILNLASNIDQNSPKRKQGLSLGNYIVLAAINRIDEPCSKNMIAAWYEKTWLTKKLKIAPKSLSAQAYWNHLEYLDDNTIEKIELGLNRRLIKLFNIELDCLLFDPTNFPTFITTPNSGSLPKRGHAKNKRYDLRIVALSLLVSRKIGMPLMHKTYAGNTPDAKHFTSIIPEFVKRFKALKRECQDITVLFDKGNNSVDNIELMRENKIHFITTLRPSSFKHLLVLSESKFTEVVLSTGKKLLACEVQEKVFELPNQRVIITKDKEGEKRALISLFERFEYMSRELTELRAKLNWKVWRNRERVEKRVAKILSRRAGKCFNVQIFGEEGALSMSIEIDGEEVKKKCDSYGRSFITTSREDLGMEEVISAYHEQYRVEDDFREMKCVESIRTNPMFHWTDQKIAAHLFICVIALILKKSLREYLALQGLSLSLKEIKRRLERVHYIEFEGPNGTIQSQLSSVGKKQSGIVKKLSLETLF